MRFDRLVTHFAIYDYNGFTKPICRINMPSQKLFNYSDNIEIITCKKCLKKLKWI